MGSEADSDRHVAEHNVPGEDWPEAFARWLAERTGGPVPRFEKVEPGDEEILEDREQRELDAVPLFLALRDDEAAGPSGSLPPVQLSRNSSSVRPSASHSASS